MGGESRMDMKLSELVQIMDSASDIRRTRDVAKQHLDISRYRQQLVKKVMEAAQVKGEQLGEEEAYTAVTQFLQTQHVFNEPKQNLLADIYIDRAKYAKKTAFLGAIGSALLAGIIGINYMVHASREAKVEENVTNHYQSFLAHQSAILDLENGRVHPVFSPNLEKKIVSAEEGLNSIKPFFLEYCQDGSCTDGITSENYRTVAKQLEQQIVKLSVIQDHIMNAKSLEEETNTLNLAHEDLEYAITELRELISVNTVPSIIADKAEALYKSGIQAFENAKTEIALDKGISLNLVYGQIKAMIVVDTKLHTKIQEIERNIHAPKRLVERARNIYELGQDAFRNAQLDEMYGIYERLDTLGESIMTLTNLPDQVEVTYKSIERIVKEESVIDSAKDLYKIAIEYVNGFNAVEAQSNLQKLKDLEQLLQQEYTIQIVQSDKYRSGSIRNHSSGEQYMYLVVEAVDDSGSVIPMNIYNSETASMVEDVPMWGIRVNPDIFERVRIDALDGIVHKRDIAVKEKGYIKPRLLFDGVNINADTLASESGHYFLKNQ
jgi:hypothetical protein